MENKNLNTFEGLNAVQDFLNPDNAVICTDRGITEII